MGRDAIHRVSGYDLAALYEVETKVLKQAVRRNIARFPEDFMFELTRDEYNSLRSQTVTLEEGRGRYSKYNAFAFTEQGVAMLASVLRNDKAIEINIQIVRAFVFIRKYALSHQELTAKLQVLEGKYDKKFTDIYEALNYLIEKDKKEIEQKHRTRIGFKQKGT